MARLDHSSSMIRRPKFTHVMKARWSATATVPPGPATALKPIRLAHGRMRPDLIFMDIVMPGMNGYQATRTLVNDPDTRAIPIVMVTSKGHEADRGTTGLRQGAVDYLIKPVSPDQLVEKAQATLAA